MSTMVEFQTSPSGSVDMKGTSESRTNRHTSENIKEMKEPSSNGFVFWVAVTSTHIIGVVLMILVIYWCRLYGEFAWASDADQQFFWHPLLMVLGLIYLYGNSIIIYRTFSFLPKTVLKIIHALLHAGAIISSSVGLAAVLENHRRTNKADFYSLHSWIGIATFGFFCLQYVVSFAAFLFPGFPPDWRAKVLPFHVFFGLGLFGMAVATAGMGMTERLLWTGNYTKGYAPVEGTVGNCVGLMLVLFTFLVFFIATHSGYKRKPLPEEVAPVN